MADDDPRIARAEAILDQIFTPAWRQHGGGAAPSSEAARDFAKLAVLHCYGDAWARPQIDLKTRSLLTLTALATLGSDEELKLHVRGALNLGHRPDDLIELLIHLMPYIGVPRVVAAMRLAAQVFQERAGA